MLLSSRYRLSLHIRNFCTKKEVRVRFAPSPTGENSADIRFILIRWVVHQIFRISSSRRVENSVIQLFVRKSTKWKVHFKNRGHRSDKTSRRSNWTIVQGSRMDRDEARWGSDVWRWLRAVRSKRKTQNIWKIHRQTAGQWSCISLLLFR